MATDWILSVLGSGALAAALVAVAGYLGRAQIAHWLNRDIEKIKARHARELEAYKVSLIAETERAKAAQDVKKSMALLIAEKRFAALDRLHRNLAVQPALLSASIRNCASTHRALTSAQYDTLTSGNSEMSAAISLCTPFLVPGELVKLRELAALCADYTVRCGSANTADVSALYEECSRELFLAAKTADAIVFGHLKSLHDMT
jgi:hypothetical protein